jgi:glycosyltransferase involved in cell wall biosynthesis
MNILICTGVYPPDIGGPAKYAENLAGEFLSRGHNVKILAYRLEKKLPAGIRHCFYFSRVIFNIWRSDLIICLDMFSTGFPAVLAGKIFNKKTILRIGGDFLWETYVEKTGNLITLKDFYSQKLKLSFKHKIIAFLEKFVLQNAAALVFNNRWQKEFFEQVYDLDKAKTFAIENFYPEKTGGEEAKEKNFLFAGRKIKFKNLKFLEEIFGKLQKEGSEAKLEIIDNLSQRELQEKIRDSYALIVASISDFAPNFIIEGIAANKPFILTKYCGLVEKLKDIGIFIDPLDRKDIKNKILFLAEDKNYNSCKEKIASFNFTHSWNEIAEEFLDIYKKL